MTAFRVTTDCRVDHDIVDDHGDNVTMQFNECDDREITGELNDQSTVALPPDGGWGWAVVAAAFVSNLIVGGICYMFGIIMPELLEYFQAGKGKTAFVGSVVPGTLSIVGRSCLLL